MSDPIRLKRRHPALIVMQALMEGVEVQLGDTKWVMAEDYRIGIPAESHPGQALTVDCDIGAFIRMCERAPQEEIIRVVMSLAANSL